MATNPPKGDNRRHGAVRNRSQTLNPKTGHAEDRAGHKILGWLQIPGRGHQTVQHVGEPAALIIDNKWDPHKALPCNTLTRPGPSWAVPCPCFSSRMAYSGNGNNPLAELSPDGVRSPRGIGRGFFSAPLTGPFLHPQFPVSQQTAIHHLVILVGAVGPSDSTANHICQLQEIVVV